jgi:hypothetical protein
MTGADFEISLVCCGDRRQLSIRTDDAPDP